MENEEKQMTGEESFGIIMEMINKTKVNINQGSFHLLFWGWLIFACSLLEFILWKFTDFAHPYYVWFFVVPGVIVSVIYGFVKGRRERVMTYATSVYVWTWVAFLFTAIVLFFLVQDAMGSYGPLILTLAAMPTFISGVILKFRPLLIGGITFWIFALIAHFGGEVLSSLATPAAMLTGYLIPGYLLRRKNNHDTV
jgi:hypothetical protein